MSKAKMPPVPPANRPKHGTGPTEPQGDKNQAADRDVNVDQVGQTAATKQNLTHQGRQQDR